MNAKTEPIIAKKTSPTPTDATVKLGSRKNVERQHRRGDAALPDDERDAEHRGGAKQPSTSGSVQPRGPASMIA